MGQKVSFNGGDEGKKLGHVGRKPQYVRSISGHEFDRMTEEAEFLGQGSYSVVFKAHERKPNGSVRNVAVKAFKSRGFAEAYAELGILKMLKHDNLVSIVGIVFDNIEEPKLVLEYIGGGSLCELLQREGSSNISISRKINICLEITRGLAYLHNCKIIHRDIATRNILLGITAKIADFGFARTVPSVGGNTFYHYTREEDEHVSIRWAPRESLWGIFSHGKKCGLYSTNSDVWSFGVLLWEMCTGARLPYQPPETSKRNTMSVVEEIMKGGNPLVSFGNGDVRPPNLMMLIMHTIFVEAENRPSAEFLKMKFSEEMLKPSLLSLGYRGYNHKVTSCYRKFPQRSKITHVRRTFPVTAQDRRSGAGLHFSGIPSLRHPPSYETPMEQQFITSSHGKVMDGELLGIVCCEGVADHDVSFTLDQDYLKTIGISFGTARLSVISVVCENVEDALSVLYQVAFQLGYRQWSILPTCHPRPIGRIWMFSKPLFHGNQAVMLCVLTHCPSSNRDRKDEFPVLLSIIMLISNSIIFCTKLDGLRTLLSSINETVVPVVGKNHNTSRESYRYLQRTYFCLSAPVRLTPEESMIDWECLVRHNCNSEDDRETMTRQFRNLGVVTGDIKINFTSSCYNKVEQNSFPLVVPIDGFELGFMASEFQKMITLYVELLRKLPTLPHAVRAVLPDRNVRNVIDACQYIYSCRCKEKFHMVKGLPSVKDMTTILNNLEYSCTDMFSVLLHEKAKESHRIVKSNIILTQRVNSQKQRYLEERMMLQSGLELVMDKFSNQFNNEFVRHYKTVTQGVNYIQMSVKGARANFDKFLTNREIEIFNPGQLLDQRLRSLMKISVARCLMYPNSHGSPLSHFIIQIFAHLVVWGVNRFVPTGCLISCYAGNAAGIPRTVRLADARYPRMAESDINFCGSMLNIIEQWETTGGSFGTLSTYNTRKLIQILKKLQFIQLILGLQMQPQNEFLHHIEYRSISCATVLRRSEPRNRHRGLKKMLWLLAIGREKISKEGEALVAETRKVFSALCFICVLYCSIIYNQVQQRRREQFGATFRWDGKGSNPSRCGST